MLRHRSDSVKARVFRMFLAEADRFRWLIGTSFGRAVVPEVGSTSAVPSGRTTPPAAPSVAAETHSRNQPAPFSGWGTRRMVGIPADFAPASTAGIPSPTTTAFGPNSAR